MAEGWQSGPRSEGPEHKAGAAVMGELGDRLTRQFGGAPGQLERAVGNSNLAEGDRRATETVGLQRVAARFEIAPVDLADQIGAAVAQNLGAVLEPEKIALDVEIARLNLCPHRAVAQHDPIGEVIEKMCHWRGDAGDSNSSLPRKRGSRVSPWKPVAPGSRFRGNDGWGIKGKRRGTRQPPTQAWGRARRAGGRLRRADRRGSRCRNGIRGPHWLAGGGTARQSAMRRPAGGCRDRRRGRRNARPSRPGSMRRRPPPCASIARNW